jgi:hypothetical protein
MLAGLAAGLTILRLSSHALVADAFVTLFLAVGFLLGAWHYVLDVEEKWHIRLWLRARGD